MTARVWHAGKPPHVGWWNASTMKYLQCWRWWNGKHWSEPAYEFDGVFCVSESAKTKASFDSAIMEWSYYWPENARVPRINPETGKVTGGKK